MIIHNSHTQVTTECSVTPNGSYSIKKTKGSNSIIKTTNKVAVFLEWLMKPELDNERKKFETKKYISFWEGHDEITVTGGFNLEHYKRVLKAKGYNYVF